MPSMPADLSSIESSIKTIVCSSYLYILYILTTTWQAWQGGK